MVKLIDFLKEQAKKANVNIEDDAFKAFFSNTALDVEVPEAMATQIGNSLISLTDAKNNHPEIKAFYTKQALDSLDKNITELMNAHEFTDDERNIVLAERSSYGRPKLLLETIVKKEQAKAANDKPQTASLQKTIDQLNEQIRQEKERANTYEKSFAQKEKDLYIQYDLDMMLGSYKTVYDTLDPKVKSMSIKQVLANDLQKVDAKFDRDAAGNLILVKNDGSNVYGDGNTQVLPKGFLEKTLSANKLLVVNSGPLHKDDNDPNGPKPPIRVDGKDQQKGATPGFKSLMADALKSVTPATT